MRDADGGTDRRSYSLPDKLSPSDGGLINILATSVKPEEFTSLVSNANNDADRTVRLHIYEPLGDDEDVIYWYASAPRVFAAIWQDITRVCEERREVIVTVELR